MKQRGTLIIFKPGAPKDQIELAMKMLKGSGLVDDSYYVRGEPTIEEFDPRYGGPVWYIP